MTADAGPPDDVRHYVRGLLTRTPAFAALEPAERGKIARDLVRVLSFLSDPAAGLGPAATLASAQAEIGTNDTLKSRLAGKQKLVGEEFEAGAGKEGAKVFRSLVTAVDFPRFVSSLIEGVYTSIVDSSIKQMQAYGKLLEGVVKSVEEFAHDNVSEEAARSFVVSSFPRAVRLDGSGRGSRLVLRDDLEEGQAPNFQAGLGMKENVALDEESEAAVVLAAQLKMARQRQHHLATMVALGINRIVVTEGEIRANVLFDTKSHDTAVRTTQASTYDSASEISERGGGWFSDGHDVQTKVSTAFSEEKEKSTADLEARAKLSGSVTVKFKSETFPLERLASSNELGAVQEKGSSGR